VGALTLTPTLTRSTFVEVCGVEVALEWGPEPAEPPPPLLSNGGSGGVGLVPTAETEVPWHLL
jgi:hypothetical protein